MLLLTLTVAALTVGPVGAAYGPHWVPAVVLVPVLLLAGLLLRPAAVVVVVVASAVSLLVAPPPAVPLLVVVAVAALTLRLAYLRGVVGIRGLRGDRALIEVKNRLKAANQIPTLPRGWGRKVAVHAAPGTLYGGDVLLSHLDGDRLRVALVDVAGKGDGVAAHAMMLSGALGGLLAEAPDFLGAANAYLLRREGAGLVTAVLLELDLGSGHYTVTCAGHPPAAQYRAGSGSWEPCPARGIALGVDPGAVWEPVGGHLVKGDAIMLYTNGMWGPRMDLDAGIDRLLGEADTLIAGGGFEQVATLTRSVGTREDDAALAVIWRI